MKHIKINFCAVIGSVCLALFFSGCLSIANSPTSRFYLLQAVDENQVKKKNSISVDMLVGIGPVKIPEYLYRPQIVTMGKENMLKFAEFDRWGEALDLGLARLIRENLTVMLPGAKYTLYPWNSSVVVKYQIIVEVIQLDSKLKNDLFFAVQWLVIDTKNMKTIILKRSEFRQPILPQNYSGLAKTLSTACASLSSEIAETLATIENHH